jgi:hypothetical protein
VLADRLFALRNHPQSGFANQTHESVASLLSFGFQGTTVDKLFDESRRPVGLAYHSEHIGQLYVREDHNGTIETTHKKFNLTHRQALMKWGEKAPSKARQAADDVSGKKLEDSACYIHRISPNRAYDPDRIDYRGKPIYSCYLASRGPRGFRRRRLPQSVR